MSSSVTEESNTTTVLDTYYRYSNTADRETQTHSLVSRITDVPTPRQPAKAALGLISAYGDDGDDSRTVTTERWTSHEETRYSTLTYDTAGGYVLWETVGDIQFICDGTMEGLGVFYSSSNFSAGARETTHVVRTVDGEESVSTQLRESASSRLHDGHLAEPDPDDPGGGFISDYYSEECADHYYLSERAAVSETESVLSTKGSWESEDDGDSTNWSCLDFTPVSTTEFGDGPEVDEDFDDITKSEMWKEFWDDCKRSGRGQEESAGTDRSAGERFAAEEDATAWHRDDDTQWKHKTPTGGWRSPFGAAAGLLWDNTKWLAGEVASGLCAIATCGDAREAAGKAWKEKRVEPLGKRWYNMSKAYGYSDAEIGDQNSLALAPAIGSDFIGAAPIAEAKERWDFGEERKLNDVEVTQKWLIGGSAAVGWTAYGTAMVAEVSPALGATMYPPVAGSTAGEATGSALNRPATCQPRGGSGRVLADGEGATPAEIAASRGGPTAGSRTGQAAVRSALIEEEIANNNGVLRCWRCGAESTNPADFHVGHRNVPTSLGGNLEPQNVALEGAACNLGAGTRGVPGIGRSCIERGGPGAPYGR